MNLFALGFLVSATFAFALPSLDRKVTPGLSPIHSPRDCILPKHFVVHKFNIFVPLSKTTAEKAIINFSYVNNGTSIYADCHYNQTSINVAPKGSTPRWACEDGRVQFIFNAERASLTLIEKACPGSP